ncbi:MAG: response regulator, partial [Desulfobacterales bacterium]|nr:response regulator [Desulfobacterales bacterium]
RKFRTIFESARDGIYLKDKHLRYTLVNPAMGRLFGLAPEAFIGKTDPDLFEKDAPENPDAEDELVLRGEVVETEENREIGGEQKTFQSIKVPMKGYNEEITGLCGFVRDQTEKKRLEAQLLQSQKMEAIGTLAGGISHDFSNIMQAVLGYCQVLMQDKPEDSTDYKDLEHIEQSVKQAVAFTRQLMTFTRKVEIELQPVDLNQVVRQVKLLLKRTFPKKIDIDLRLSESLFTVNADPGQLQQVLLNIGINARDAMPGGGRLVIETANADPEEGSSQDCRVLLAVEDTGSGMSEEVRKQIFEPFYTTKGAEGTGLGLAMVSNIIENHGGRISCQSQPGQGTRFNIYLPAARGPAAPKSETGPASVEKGLGETILVIDDEVYLRDFIETMLNRNGYRVIMAASGEEGIELYQKHRDSISAVILDLNMPGMGGRQCLAGLMDLNPQARVIVSTGDRSQFDPSDPVLQKACQIVQKPFEIREMLGKIKELLADRS